MSTTVTPTELIAKAMRREGDREVILTWRSPELIEKLPHTGEAVGVQIDLDIDHDPKRKQYRAVIRKAHYSPDPRFFVTHWSPFDRNYWSVTVATQPVARFGAKSFAEFEQSVIASLDNTMSETVAYALSEVARII